MIQYGQAPAQLCSHTAKCVPMGGEEGGKVMKLFSCLSTLRFSGVIGNAFSLPSPLRPSNSLLLSFRNRDDSRREHSCPGSPMAQATGIIDRNSARLPPNTTTSQEQMARRCLYKKNSPEAGTCTHLTGKAVGQLCVGKRVEQIV